MIACGCSLLWWFPLVGSVVTSVICLIWYSPLMFGQLWADSYKLSQEVLQKNNSLETMAKSFVTHMIIAWVMSMLFSNFLDSVTFSTTAVLSFYVWIVIAATHYSDVIWNGKSSTGFAIDVSAILVYLMALAAVYVYIG